MRGLFSWEVALQVPGLNGWGPELNILTLWMPSPEVWTRTGMRGRGLVARCLAFGVNHQFT